MSRTMSADGQDQLGQERAQLLRKLTHLHELMQGEVDIELEEGDAEIVEHQKHSALMDLLRQKLRAIDSALRSIEVGQYGICEQCNDPIGQERLQVIPYASLCINCQHKMERLARRNMPVRRIEW